MTIPIRPQQSHLSWPWTASQVEDLDTMLQTLFKRLGALSRATTDLTEGSVVFANANSLLSQDNDHFFWDDTNNRLGIGTDTPSCTLHTYTALGNSALGSTGVLISGKRDDLSGRFFQVQALNADGSSNSYPFEIARDNGVAVRDYLVVSGQRKSDGTFESVFGANQGMIAVYPDIAAGATASSVYVLSNGTNVDFLHMDALASIDVDGTIHGTRKFTFDAFGNAIAVLSWMAPFYYGGTSTTQVLDIRTTTGNAVAGAVTQLTTGNNGATLGLYMDYQGRIGLGGITNPATNLEVLGAEQRLRGSGSNISYWGFYDSNGTTRRGTVGNVVGDIWLNSDTGSIQLIPATRLKAYPGSNSATAFQFFKADSTTIVFNIDTSNTRVGIGIAAPTAGLHLPAGTASANTAPLKFISGTNLTSAEAGAMEWDGTNLFISQTTGPTRKTLKYTTDFPYIAASTFEKAETGTDANVLTYTTNASTDEALHIGVMTDVSALTGTSVVVTVTWKDSNNATATVTTTLSGVSDGTINVPINAFKNTNVVISTVFTGVSTTYNISAIITRNK